ncbi:MAG: hypothetical protein RMH84_06925 [Sulfolobales archaeon]|nr:hypothetical protein [Sulfolobales archaeon]MCX8209136.1 hypothetical protein [Sulfolobales archaeon]MDW8011305.1 hypothetical protein [Sulfolobales archaeon]
MKRRLLVKKGLNHLLNLYMKYKLELFNYNENIRSTGYYVKPIHVAYRSIGRYRVKYIYFGRYWYRVSRRGSRLMWIYLGKEKPEPSLPDPPLNPFEGISAVVVDEEDIEIRPEALKLLAEIELAQNQVGIFTELALKNLQVRDRPP